MLKIPILHIKEPGCHCKGHGEQWQRPGEENGGGRSSATGQCGEKLAGVGTDTSGDVPTSVFNIVCGSGGAQGSTLERYSMATSGARSRMDSGQPHVFKCGLFHR